MDFSRVVTPQDQTPRTFEDQLVQWAWFNSPGNAIYKEQIEIAAKRKNLTWWELLDANVSFNLNEGNLLQDSISCLLYTSPSPRDQRGSRMPSSA